MALCFSAKKATVNICGRSSSLYVTHTIAVFFNVFDIVPYPSKFWGGTYRPCSNRPCLLSRQRRRLLVIHRTSCEISSTDSWRSHLPSHCLFISISSSLEVGESGGWSCWWEVCPWLLCSSRAMQSRAAWWRWALAAGAGWPLLGWDKAAGSLQCWLDRAGSLCSSTAWPSQRNPWSVFGMTFEGWGVRGPECFRSWASHPMLGRMVNKNI